MRTKVNERDRIRRKIRRFRTLVMPLFMLGFVCCIIIFVICLWGGIWFDMGGATLVITILSIATILCMAIAIAALCFKGKAIQSGMRELGDVVGMPLADIADVLDRPNIHVRTQDVHGKPARLSIWRNIGYSIIMKFDEHDTCLGIAREEASYIRDYDKRLFSFKPIHQTPFDER